MPRIGLLACLLGTWLTGCVPNATQYYRPSVEGGRQLTTGHCVPLPRAVVFQVGPLPVRALLGAGARTTYVDLRLGDRADLPDAAAASWQSYHFTADRFLMRDLARDTLSGPLTRFTSSPDVTETSTQPRWVEVRIPKPLPARFEFISPPIMVDGQSLPFPVIRFEKTLWMGISPFNC